MKGFLILIILSNSKIMPSLKEILKNTGPGEKIAALVYLKEKPDYERIKNLPAKEYVEFLKRFSKDSQREILNYLEENFQDKIEEIKPYWIFNGFYLKAEKDVIEKLAEREEVDYIIENFIIEIEKPEISYELRTPEWNIIQVKADSCWMAGYDGTGIIIGHMDTGVDASHPALQGKWLEPYWYDAVNGQANPYDDNGHGTFTMGIILGDSVGVAPDAKFVTCKCFDAYGTGQASEIHMCFQKIAEWKSQGLDIKAVNNSWDTGSPTSTEFWNDCLNWRNLGIIPVFQIGDYGPGSGTAVAPGNYPFVIGVGASDFYDNIPPFSSRGPGPNGIIKPDLVAPGDSVKSCLPGGGYGYSSSTGFATSHVTGGIAIFFEKNPDLNYDMVYSVLTDYARQVPQGAPYPNYDYGWGILNLYQSLIHVPLSVSENYSEDKDFIRVYSVLSMGEICVEARGEIFIFNSSGMKVFSTGIKHGSQRIKINGVKSGVYFINSKGKKVKIIVF